MSEVLQPTSTALRARLARFFNPAVEGFRAPQRVFWVALAVRLLYMTLAHTWRVKPVEDHYLFGFEAGRIAAALATGHGYSDPFSNGFLRHTGPTAWLPPAFPLLMAAVFKLFGVYTAASAWIILAIDCVFSALTALAVWELGARFAGHRNALWSGWLWALYPAASQYAVRWIWEMSLTTALFAFLLVLALRMRAEPEKRPLARWTWFGLAWALIALSNSTLLIFLPVCGIWILLGVRKRHDLLRTSLAGTSLAAVLFLASVAPWTIRNWLVFHTFIPLRGNLGAELYLGNGPHAEGFLMEYNHPFQSPPQLRLYARMGEVAYVKMRGSAASAVIAGDRGLFLRNTAKRVFFFWASVPHAASNHPVVEFLRVLDFSFLSLSGLLGLALSLRLHLAAAALFAWAFVLLPIPYYVVTVHARFRHPLEPLICVLAVFLFQSARKRIDRPAPAG